MSKHINYLEIQDNSLTNRRVKFADLENVLKDSLLFVGGFRFTIVFNPMTAIEPITAEFITSVTFRDTLTVEHVTKKEFGEAALELSNELKRIRQLYIDKFKTHRLAERMVVTSKYGFFKPLHIPIVSKHISEHEFTFSSLTFNLSVEIPEIKICDFVFPGRSTLGYLTISGSAQTFEWADSHITQELKDMGIEFNPVVIEGKLGE